MDHFFNLGFNRVFCWASALVLLAQFCYASDGWGSHDSENLALIESYVEYIQDDVSEMLSDNTYFKNRLSTIETLLDAFVSTPDGNAVYTFYNGVRDVTNTITAVQHSVDNGFSSLSNTLFNVATDLAMHIDNLTNFVFQSSSFPTNFPAMFTWNDSDENLRNLFWLLYGHLPTALELSYFRSTLGWSGGLGSVVKMLGIQHVSWYDLPSSELDDYSFAFPDDYPSSYDEDTADAQSHLYYYQYGTRPLLDSFNSFVDNTTNDYNLTSAIIHTPDTGDGEGHSYSSGFVSTVGALAENAIESLPSVSSDDLTPANTNDIDDVGNDSYSNAKQRLFRTDPETAISPEVMSTLNDRTFSSDLANALENADTLPGFTFDLSGFNSFGNSVRSFSSSPNNVTLQLVDIKSSTVQYVDFILDIVDCGLVLIFGCLFWDFLRKETSNWALWG